MSNSQLWHIKIRHCFQIFWFFFNWWEHKFHLTHHPTIFLCHLCGAVYLRFLSTHCSIALRVYINTNSNILYLELVLIQQCALCTSNFFQLLSTLQILLVFTNGFTGVSDSDFYLCQSTVLKSMLIEACIDDERQFKTAKHPQVPGDATVRKRFFRDNFVTFRRRSKRIAFLESVKFSVCLYANFQFSWWSRDHFSAPFWSISVPGHRLSRLEKGTPSESRLSIGTIGLG